ncbi:hypothetical protein BTR23_22160 [Alkalihalophilus pseudofirmus]|nr:hypothetical protein BTR23_22160 [Alkalihalophilus pseudofirmus]
MENLTPKQRRFVQEYMIDLNATQAAIRVGYSQRTAYSIGQENLSKPEIKQAIEEQMDEVSRRNQITVDDIVNQLSKIAFADIRDFVTWDEHVNVKVKKSAEVDGTVIAEISSSETVNGKSFKFKRNDN